MKTVAETVADTVSLLFPLSALFIFHMKFESLIEVSGIECSYLAQV